MSSIVSRHEFTANPVGQGFFYSGKIELDQSQFNLVFDCGTMSSIDPFVIQEYKRNLEKRPVDLLVISHFDGDHINKIGELIGKEGKGDCRPVKNLVIPFMNFQERLFLALRLIQATSENFDGPYDPISIIIDPIGTLGPNLSGGNVIVVTPGPHDPVPSEGQSELEPKESLTFDIPGKRSLTPDQLNDFGMSEEFNISSFEANDSQKGYIYSNNRHLEFVFYRKKVGDDDRAFFRTVCDLFLKANHIKEDDVELLRKTIEVIKNLKGAPVIKEHFKKAFDQNPTLVEISKGDVLNMNTTSLSMLHGTGQDLKLEWPRIHYNMCYGFNLGERRNRCYRKGDFPRDFGDVLLTSDSFLKDDADVIEFWKHYDRYISRIFLFQIPHHGSKNNADGLLFSRVSMSLIFINYGIRHKHIKKYKHPDNEVISDVSAMGLTPIPVNEYIGLCFFYKVQL